MISQHDIEAFADDQPVREEEFQPLSVEASFIQWQAYTLWALGFRASANALLRAIGVKTL